MFFFMMQSPLKTKSAYNRSHTHRKHMAPIVAKQKLLQPIEVHAKEEHLCFHQKIKTHILPRLGLLTFVWQVSLCHISHVLSSCFQKFLKFAIYFLWCHIVAATDMGNSIYRLRAPKIRF